MAKMILQVNEMRQTRFPVFVRGSEDSPNAYETPANVIWTTPYALCQHATSAYKVLCHARAYYHFGELSRHAYATAWTCILGSNSASGRRAKLLNLVVCVTPMLPKN
eukprot:COSAG02_NODE_6837_length_3336_cov_2.065802_2_plen_107_part_00